ncbi:major facilitator superfamily domain-containing protein, partial [Microdochium trichocladiopsis]
DAEKNYKPKSLGFWSIILGLYLTVFIIALDRLIIATAIPKITDEFHATGDIGWYGSAYMLPAACFNPVSGRVYQMYGTKVVFTLSLVLFEIGSAVCGAAPSSIAFILGRAIAGTGSAFLQSGTMLLLLPIVPLRKRPMFMAGFGIVFALASVIGPLLGGSLTDKVTWRWCFYINLPVGAFVFLAMIFFFPNDARTTPSTVASATNVPPTTRSPFIEHFLNLDPLGILCLVPSIISLILALQWGGSTDAWSSPKIVGLLVTFAVLLVAFVLVETVVNPSRAFIPMRIVTQRSIAGAMCFVFCIAGSMMAVVYYLSIWFQAVQGNSAIDSGLHTLPIVVALVVSSIAGAVATQKIGYYTPAMLLTPVLASIGAGLLSLLTPSSGEGQWLGFQVLYGLGLGMGLQAPSLVPQTVLARADVPIGVALTFFMQQLGGAVFIAVAQNIFAGEIVERLSGVSGLDPALIVGTGATDIRQVVKPEQLDLVVDAYSYGLTRCFVMAAAFSAAGMLAALCVEWRTINAKKGGKGGDGGEATVVEE